MLSVFRPGNYFLGNLLSRARYAVMHNANADQESGPQQTLAYINNTGWSLIKHFTKMKILYTSASRSAL